MILVKRDTFIAVGLLGLAALLLPARVLLGVEIAPATAHDILRALGPDASGLRLSQDTLPDLFALTANRIEENPKQFTVEQPYLSGRWKGGKVVIEYARDLSYTLVSIYDKDGHRQRIYSVATAFNNPTIRQTSPAPQTASVESSNNQESGWGRQATPPPPAPSQAAPGAQSNVSFEWDDAKGAYVPVMNGPAVSAVTETPPSRVAAPRTAARSETTSTSRRRRRHHANETVVASAQTFTPAPAKKSSLPAPMQDSGIWLPPGVKTKTSSSASRSVVKAGHATWVERPEDTRSQVSAPRKKKHKHPVSETAVAKASSAQATQAPAPETTKASDEWVPKSIQQPPARPQREEAAKRAVDTEVPSTEDLLVNSDTKSGPDTSESDKWAPKATPKQTAREPEVPEAAQEPVKVAMVPKSGPVDNSVDNLLKMANAGKEEAPRDSDTWVPKKTAAVNPEAEINKELARVQAEERKQEAPKPKVQPIRQDVNNPEEGVLPVSSFEKFSGPMYGRHREYERRFYPGKKSKSKAPVHDFYVDEVDRKKEIHNIYYYTHQKGKAPRLVAVERHDKVSFMGNYDIDKEDSGKISTYN
jgi:hypothetical protein